MNTQSKTLTDSLQQNLDLFKQLLPSEDILTSSIKTADGVCAALIYADGMVNKQLLGELVEKPLSRLTLFNRTQAKTSAQAENNEKNENKSEKSPLQAEDNTQKENKTSVQVEDNGENKGQEEDINELKKLVRATILFPELKELTDFNPILTEILDGNSALIIDGLPVCWIVGAKLLPVRTITEPPSDVAIKGPREGFIEDIKTNMTLVRKRLKTPLLTFEQMKIGRRSDTSVVICSLEGISNKEVKEKLRQKLENIDVDCIVDSSYIAALIAPKKHSIFKQVGTTEKPDVFTAKIAEGRVGILVDGSPIALTLPYLLTEDLQSSEDYFISPTMATIFRTIRAVALFISLSLPAFYVTAQLFKMQLLPLGLMLTIAGSIQSIPLSPSLEIFVVLLLLEILKEASIRMPKYVGMSLSVVGALVLGEAAVSAGFLSTPAIIVVAISGICLYTVPNFVETGSILRWVFLLVAGSIGVFGIVLFTAFLLYYLIDENSFGVPLLAPFAPLSPNNLRDTVVKYGFEALTDRPTLFGSKNKTRLRF